MAVTSLGDDPLAALEPDCALSLLPESACAELIEERSLADPAVANEDKLDNLIVFIVGHHGFAQNIIIHTTSPHRQSDTKLKPIHFLGLKLYY